MIRMLVPPNGKFWLAPKPTNAIVGTRAIRPKYSEPGQVIRCEAPPDELVITLNKESHVIGVRVEDSPTPAPTEPETTPES